MIYNLLRSVSSFKFFVCFFFGAGGRGGRHELILEKCVMVFCSKMAYEMFPTKFTFLVVQLSLAYKKLLYKRHSTSEKTMDKTIGYCSKMIS